jgi:glycerol uptake facilitator-like aquaporin
MQTQLSPSRFSASFWVPVLAEWVGTAMLLCVVIGSGIMAERLAAGNAAVALLGNTLATVFALFVLIELFGPVSGAHFNPLVTLVLLLDQPANSNPGDFNLTRLKALAFILAQLTGAVCGAWLANAMFDLSIIQFSSKLRGGTGQWLAECVATAGLLFVILHSGRTGVHAKASVLVASYIGAAYWFTASTSFANPAAVMGRMWSDSFAGIAPASAWGFVLSQMLGALLGWALARLFRRSV